MQNKIALRDIKVNISVEEITITNACQIYSTMKVRDSVDGLR